MDTTAIKAAFSQFSTDFGTFSTDLQAYLVKNVPQDTPEQVADLQNITTGLGALDSTVKQLDATINPPAAPAPAAVPAA